MNISDKNIMDVASYIGARIKAARKAKRYSIEAFALLLGVDRATVTRMENGEVTFSECP